jgi:hypothetical protein
MLAGAGLLAGAWSLLPPYSGPALNTAARVEFADHVVPGLLVVGISVLSLVLAQRGDAQRLLFNAGLGVVLAGFWMVATHLPLVLQATREQAPWGATAYHTAPWVAVLVLGIVWVLISRSESLAQR